MISHFPLGSGKWINLNYINQSKRSGLRNINGASFNVKSGMSLINYNFEMVCDIRNPI